MQARREIGALPATSSVEHEQRGLAYASQFRRKQLHQFEPWPGQYTIKHIVRNPRSGILIASKFSALCYNTLKSNLTVFAGGHRGGESSVS